MRTKRGRLEYDCLLLRLLRRGWVAVKRVPLLQQLVEVGRFLGPLQQFTREKVKRE